MLVFCKYLESTGLCQQRLGRCEIYNKTFECLCTRALGEYEAGMRDRGANELSKQQQQGAYVRIGADMATELAQVRTTGCVLAFFFALDQS